jgi:Fe-S cluster assembly protein SufD
VTVSGGTQHTKSYVEQFAALEGRTAGNRSAWVHPLRKAALARFVERGFPTTRDEDWKFTNLAPIAQTAFRLPDAAGRLPEPETLQPFGVAGLSGTRLVFVDGRFAPALSRMGTLPRGVVAGSLAEALGTQRALVEPHLAQYADFMQDAFTALNTAFMEDGAMVWIPRGAVLEEPIHILHVSTAAAFPVLTTQRNLIVTQEDSQAAVIEDYVSLGEGVTLSNAVTEAVVGQNGVLEHYLVERENRQSSNVSTLRVQQGRSSNVTSHSVLLGGDLVRNNVHPVMAGEGGECLINGLFLATDRQHMDNFMRVEHASPHCGSRQFYNGVLDGHAHGVFHGRIVVHKDAQKTDAKQTNRNLLLSEDAQVDTKPQLEIYADDVKCTHGATIGQINEDALFYLRARGLSRETARALLLFAFANECLQRMRVAPMRRHLEGLVARWIPKASLLEGLS